MLYTDGVTDQGPGAGRSPEHVLRDLGGEPSAGALADALREEAERWNAVLRDDVAIVALRCVGTAVGTSMRPARVGGARRLAEPA